jgi:hypothetical protein
MLGFLVIAALAALFESGGSTTGPSMPSPIPPQSGYGQPNPVTGYTPAPVGGNVNINPVTPTTLIYSAQQSNTTPNSQISQQGSVTPVQQQEIFASMQSQTKQVINVGKTATSSASETYGGILVLSRIGRGLPH